MTGLIPPGPTITVSLNPCTDSIVSEDSNGEVDGAIIEKPLYIGSLDFVVGLESPAGSSNLAH